ncbi:MAG TPA: serine hydrolase [Bradyrhizobium sp.]|nr:serine hydrolase [Bradyrhizobium sp.]
MTWRKWIASALVLAAPAALGVYFRPDCAIRVVTSTVADAVCAKTFVSGIDPQAAFAETVDRPRIRRLRWVMRYQVDGAAKTVDASVMGLLGSRAAFHDGFGCVLLHGSKEPYLPRSDIDALKAPRDPPLLPEIAGPEIVEPSDPALKTALDHAFEEPAEPPFRRTKAVVVVHDGKIIAERYASGIGAATPLLGFSMTKSVVNALIGVLVRQGVFTPSMPAPIPEWRAVTDPRHEIRIGHLMRMTSGLALDETNFGFDPSSRMYLYDDMAGFAVKAPMMARPGTRWQYSSAATQLLARIISDAVGGPEKTLAFAWRELFNPLGMRDVTLAFDAGGMLQGSANMLASARDWARFGLLYLNDGVIDGRRILQNDWVAFSTTATLNTDYGAGFWTNRSEHPNAQWRVRLGIPRDAFFAFGLLGQSTLIIPSQHLVIVRLGDSVEPAGDISGLGRLVQEVIAAMQTQK